MPLFNEDEPALIMAARATEALSFVQVVADAKRELQSHLDKALNEYDRICAYHRRNFADTVMSSLSASQGRILDFSSIVE